MPNIARLVQLALFLHDPGELKADTVMVNLLGVDPDSYQHNKVPSPGSPFKSSARVSGETLKTLNVSQGRIDLLITPPEGSQLSDGKFPFFDAEEELQLLLQTITLEGLRKLPPIYRVALVTIFVERCESLAEASRLFFKRSGISEVSGETSDLLFQINRPSQAPDGLERINRIVNISIESFQEFEVAGVPGTLLGAGARVRNEAIFLATAVDINNVPTSEIISPERAVHLLSNFADSALNLYVSNSVSES